MSTGFKSKLAKLEAKAQPKTTIQEQQDLTLDLAYSEYLLKHMPDDYDAGRTTEGRRRRAAIYP
jgi:hypothetical protein